MLNINTVNGGHWPSVCPLKCAPERVPYRPSFVGADEKNFTYPPVTDTCVYVLRGPFKLS